MTQNLGSTSNPLSMTGEQWVIEERTDDPLSPEPGECWIRTDLNAGDKMATLKFGDGSEVPIFPTGTSEPGVLEVRRVQTGGQTGYLPVAEPDESSFPQFRLQHNNTVYSLHDDIEPGTIPDSEADQKLSHRYIMAEGSETSAEDAIGTNDWSLQGLSWTPGSWVAGYALTGDGTNDRAESDVPNHIYENLNSDWAIAFSFQTTSSETARFFGGRTGNNPFVNPQINPDNEDNGTILFQIRGPAGSSSDQIVKTAGGFADGGQYRAVLNKTGNTANDMDIWINQLNETVTRDSGDPIASGEDSNFTWMHFAWNNDGSIIDHFEGTLDDVCYFNDALTQAEIESYQNPWS